MYTQAQDTVVGHAGQMENKIPQTESLRSKANEAAKHALILDRLAELEMLARPLQEFLKRYYNPEHGISLSYDTVNVYRRELGVPFQS